MNDNFTKGNILISYTFPKSGVMVHNIDNERVMKSELTELVKSWKERGFVGHFIIGDDEVISDKLK